MTRDAVLSVDSAGSLLAIGLEIGGVCRSRTWNSPHAHQEHLLTGIQALLAESARSVGALAAISVVVGPGSFTGLRVGLSAAKALAWGLAIPLFGENRLDLMAGAWARGGRAAGETEWVLPSVDARRKSIFTALFRDGERKGDYLDLPHSELPKLFQDPSRFLGHPVDRLRLLGDWPEPLRLGLPQSIDFDGSLPLDLSGECCRLARLRLGRGEAGDDPRTLAPFYLRAPEPELKLAAAHAAKLPRVDEP
ncbi:MAG: tRNA (adenosine(37)-N6)-threonylcarbamoyltransferase complex dimerization subunit type 1 TsaB [Spirochaetes bacterium]|nr:tRNA (adenosine(37)-N6)-threonylcarbamoyltransferase complex dimerization subunit type 1 TsaB [Spirochaetota bacterium]